MNSSNSVTPLRPVSLQNLNLGKFWTSTAITGWVDSIYSQSEVYIKHEKDLREEESKQQMQTGIGSSNEPIEIDSMGVNNSSNTNNNSSNTNNNNMNNNMNINSNNSGNSGNNISTTVNTSGSYHVGNVYMANRS